MRSNSTSQESTPWELEKHQLLTQIQTLQDENFYKYNEGVKHQAMLITKMEAFQSELKALKAQNQILKSENQRLRIISGQSLDSNNNNTNHNIMNSGGNGYYSGQTVEDHNDGFFFGGTQLTPASMTPFTPARPFQPFNQSLQQQQQQPQQQQQQQQFLTPSHRISLQSLQNKQLQQQPAQTSPNEHKRKPAQQLELHELEQEPKAKRSKKELVKNKENENDNEKGETTENTETISTKSKAQPKSKTVAKPVSSSHEQSPKTPTKSLGEPLDKALDQAKASHNGNSLNHPDLITEETLRSLRNPGVEYSKLSINQLISQIQLDFKDFFQNSLVPGAVFQNHHLLDKTLFIYFAIHLKVPIISIQKTKYKKSLENSKRKPNNKPKKDLFEYLCANCRAKIFEVSQLTTTATTTTEDDDASSSSSSSLQRLEQISHNHKCDLDVTLKALISMRKKGINRKASGLDMEQETAKVYEIEKNLIQFAEFVDKDEELFNLFLYATSFKLIDLNFLTPVMLSLLFDYYYEATYRRIDGNNGNSAGSSYSDSFDEAIADLIQTKKKFNELRSQFISLFLYIFRFDKLETLNKLQGSIRKWETSSEPASLELATEVNKKRLLTCDFSDKYSKLVRNSILKRLNGSSE